MRLDRAVVGLTGKLVVTGEIPEELHGRPLLLTANHIGNFDVLVLVAACHKIGIAPRFMATGGLFDAPVVGWVLRKCNHVRVDRGKTTAVDALRHGVDALAEGDPVLVYPEGRISQDPGLWPERGKTGAARIALASGAAVIPVSQWGAHEAMDWGTLTVEKWADLKILLVSWLRAVRRRPVFRVHFGPPVDLSDLSTDRPGDAVRARDRIMRAIANGLAGLRADEFDAPRHHDPTRPTVARSPWKPEHPPQLHLVEGSPAPAVTEDGPEAAAS
ncbi:MAG TPA: lysophospholipid acyltransferase family protein [Pseudonocardiaceae bacterium]